MDKTILRVELAEASPGAENGLLAGLRFVVKDNFDVAGHRTGCGQPMWLADASPAAKTAPAIETLLGAGARLVGKAQQDELAFSMSGTNVHYGTPPNPAAPDREPGGSSCGSVSAVAGGHVDFALGSDTAGSTRVPASYCGVLGFRPTHGRIPTVGMVPLAPRFDTVGWFARTAEVLALIGRAFWDGNGGKVERLLVARDAQPLLDPDCGSALDEAVAVVAARLGIEAQPIDLAEDEGDLAAWCTAFRHLQVRQAWAYFGEWITRRRPNLGPGIAARFAAAAEVTADQEAAAETVRASAVERFAVLLSPGVVLALPTAAGPAPPLGLDRAAKDAVRVNTLRLSTLSPLVGVPAVSLPLGRSHGLPLGLSLLAGPGEDELLLSAATTILP